MSACVMRFRRPFTSLAREICSAVRITRVRLCFIPTFPRCVPETGRATHAPSACGRQDRFLTPSSGPCRVRTSVSTATAQPARLVGLRPAEALKARTSCRRFRGSARPETVLGERLAVMPGNAHDGYHGENTLLPDFGKVCADSAYRGRRSVATGRAPAEPRSGPGGADVNPRPVAPCGSPLPAR